ncbi:MAG TPA: hypothetical protein VK631_26715 [Solirubrobacteraceae bacterium]|nr:hypothetical protein [Solirubrobacteraceae bacterium]
MNAALTADVEDEVVGVDEEVVRPGALGVVEGRDGRQQDHADPGGRAQGADDDVARRPTSSISYVRGDSSPTSMRTFCSASHSAASLPMRESADERHAIEADAAACAALGELLEALYHAPEARR